MINPMCHRNTILLYVNINDNEFIMLALFYSYTFDRIWKLIFSTGLAQSAD